MRTTLAYTRAFEDTVVALISEGARACRANGCSAEADALVTMCRQVRIDLLAIRTALGCLNDPEQEAG